MATLNLGRIKPVFRGAYSGATAYVVDDIVTANGASYICIQAHSAGTQAVSVTAYWTEMSAAGSNPQLSMTWDNATADADNGAGKIAWNHATIASATVLYVDDADDGSANIQPYVDTWDAVTNTTAKGIVTITKEGTPSTFATFKVTGAVVDATGYSKIPVTHLASNGTFSDGDGVGVNFNYSGLDGTDLTSTITTQGDVLYRDGSGLARLAAGTSGQFLKTQGAGANPVWAGSGLAMQSVVTGATLTAVAGRSYPINTTSNACTITLPASASAGDEIKFIDYARKWGTNKITLDQNSLNFQGNDSVSPEYDTDGQSVTIIYVDATQGWIPTVDDDVTHETELAIRYLVIGGGGGGGGDNGGGGGAGGLRGGLDDDNGKFTPAASTTYTAVIGGGGGGVTSGVASSGTDSTLAGSGLTTITANGGGAGASAGSNGATGGSGGAGGQGKPGGAGNEGSFTPVEGYAGGSGNNSSGGGSGGGGAGGVGANATGATGQASVGHGGIAKTSDITGSTVYYAGGGGGGANQAAQSYFGLGGGHATNKGGGGNGGSASTNTADNGTANTGGGAGGGSQGGSWPGGTGGSGVVIVRMPDAVYSSSTGTVTVDTSTVTDVTILTFTSGTGTFTTTAF